MYSQVPSSLQIAVEQSSGGRLQFDASQHSGTQACEPSGRVQQPHPDSSGQQISSAQQN
jgi:hypothetical protein